MSHELRTPLNAVIGFSELLRDNPIPPEELDDYLRSINLAGNTLLKLINDILDLSKIDANQMKISPEPTELPAVARELYAMFRRETAKRRLEYRVECPEALPPMMLDGLRLRQILLNLIGNAVKFTQRGHVEVLFAWRNGQSGDPRLGQRVRHRAGSAGGRLRSVHPPEHGQGQPLQ